jgi:uncharacterized protein (TIGR02594 family)
MSYTYGYDSNNRLATLNNGQTSYALVTDAAGNITSDARHGQAYQFDVAHRMTAVTGKESYLYDGTGRRARTLNATTGTIEYFGYGADGRLLQDWSNRRGVRNAYIYLGNTLVALYEVNITTGATASRYKHTDALGSPVATTDAAKAVLSRSAYTPYGVPMAPVDGVGYTGHFIDVTTGLTYMQQRYYDPQIGRFLSIDPDQRAFSKYAYANNEPYRNIDPDGRNFQSILPYPEDSPQESGGSDYYGNEGYPVRHHFRMGHVAQTGTPWLDSAEGELGAAEDPGPENNQRILEYLGTVRPVPNNPQDNTTAWCAAFVQATLATAHIPGTGKSNALSYRTWDVALDKPALGAIAVHQDGHSWKGHVGYVAGVMPSGRIVVLGGNQGNMVKYSSFPADYFFTYRYPTNWVPDFNLPVYTSVPAATSTR